jgi:hypothetical protein
MPSIKYVGQLLVMTVIIMIMIFVVKKAVNKFNIPILKTVADEV